MLAVILASGIMLLSAKTFGPTYLKRNATAVNLLDYGDYQYYLLTDMPVLLFLTMRFA